MGMSRTLQRYLDAHRVRYKLVPHRRTASAIATAHAANVPAGCLAKSVVLEDARGYLLAVLPANHRLELSSLQSMLKRELDLASEREAESLFGDCEPGAIPPFGEPYGVEEVVDDSLRESPAVFFESGDHGALVCVSNRVFRTLVRRCRHGRFSERRDNVI
ncbi:MAG TPA: YbaK/EbsC family protein [Acidiferrobacterales bacterium]